MNISSTSLQWSKQLSLIHYVSLIVVLFFAFYYGLGAYAIRDINEGLYAKIAWEMWMQGDYVIPTVNQLPYLEKPPFLYWLISGSYQIFGVNAWAARFIPATAGVLLCLALVAFGNRIHRPREGWLAALILATSPIVLLAAQTVFFDMVLIVLFSAALMSFYLWYQKNKRWWLRAAYVFAAMAILTKGLLNLVLIPLVGLVYMLLTRAPWRRYLQLFDILGILLFVIIVAPWHILATLQHEGFAWEYFVNEHFLRFFAKREPFDYQTGPFYHYLPLMIIYLLPWSIILLVSFLQRHIYRPIEPIHKFLWVWILVPLIFFSLSKAKSDYYMLIATPAMAFLLALGLQEYIRLQKYKTLLFSLVFILVSLAVAAWMVGYTDLILTDINELPAKSVFKQALWILAVYTLIILVVHLLQHKPIVTIICLVGLVFPMQYTIVNMQRQLNNLISSQAAVDYLLTNAGENNVYLYQDYESISSVPFYMQRPLPIIDSQSEDLVYGQKAGAQADRWFITGNDFATLSRRNTVYVVLAKPRRLVSFAKIVDMNQFCEVLRNGHVIVLTNNKKQC